MDFALPPTLPLGGISWDHVLPPLLSHLNGITKQSSWTPTELLLPVNENAGAAQVVCDNNGFVVQLDVKNYCPEELTVKVTGDYVVVEGKHEQKKNGVGCRVMALESAMSPEGMLVISAPLAQGETAVPHVHSGP
ncbi:hypothetical protein NFI96_019424 [Prochilodus magdalenae]|nr:hypothetical protein NFI96_019424 [Prochilodus magdalenae]